MSFVRNVGALSVANIVVQGIRFAYSFIFRMILGPQLTGIWNLANLVLGYLLTATSGISVGSERKIPILHGQEREGEANRVRSLLFSVTTLESLVVSLLLWGYLLWQKDGYGENEFWALIGVGFYAVLTRLMSSYYVAFRTIHQFVNLSKVMVVAAILDVVIVLPAIHFFSFHGLLVGFGISSAGKLAWADSIRRRHRLFPMGIHIDWKRLKGLLSVGFPITVGNYFWKVFVTLDSLLIVWLMGTTSLAYYTVGAAMLIQLSEIPTNVSTVLAPRLFEKFGKFSGVHSLRDDLRKFFSGTLLCIAPVLCTLGFFGIPFLVRHLIPKFGEGIIVAQILIFALFFVPQTHVPNQILILMKRRVEYSVLIVVGIMAVGAFTLLLYRRYGSIAAVALGALSGYALYFVLLVYRVLKTFFRVEDVWWVYRRLAATFVWCSAVLWGITAYHPEVGESLVEGCLFSAGKTTLALVLISPIVWFGGTESGVKEMLVGWWLRRRSPHEVAGSQSVNGCGGQRAQPRGLPEALRLTSIEK